LGSPASIIIKYNCCGIPRSGKVPPGAVALSMFFGKNLRYFYCRSIKIYNNLTWQNVIICQASNNKEKNYGVYYFRNNRGFITDLSDLRNVQPGEILI